MPAVTLANAIARQSFATYGHSYLIITTQLSSTSNRYDTAFSIDTDSTDYSRARSGSEVEDLVGVVTNSTTKWTSGEVGTVIFHGLLNSLRHNGNTAPGITSATNAVRSILAILTASTRIEETSPIFTFTGTWSASTPAFPQTASGGGIKSTVTQNDFVQWVQPSPVCYLLSGCQAAAGGAQLRVQDVTAGGTVLGTYDMSSGTIVSGNGWGSGASSSTSQYAIPISAPEGHLIQVTKIDAGAGPFIFDALLPRALYGPTIALMKEQFLPAIGYTFSGPTYNHGSDAAVTAYNAIYTTMAAEFPNTVVVDVPTWNKSTCIGVDNIHPNDAGAYAFKISLEAALLSYWRSTYVQQMAPANSSLAVLTVNTPVLTEH